MRTTRHLAASSLLWLCVACAPESEQLASLRIQERLLDRVDEARLSLVQKGLGSAAPEGLLLTTEEGIRIEIEIPVGSEWEQLPAVAASIGRRLGELVPWRLSLPPDARLGSGFEISREGSPVDRWRSEVVPAPGSAMVSPGGFLQVGLYAALAEGEDPASYRWGLRFNPAPALLAVHLLHEGEAVSPRLLVSRVEERSEARRALQLPCGSRIELPVAATSEGRLELAVPRGTTDGAQLLRVELVDGDEILSLQSEAIGPSSDDTAWRELRYSLPTDSASQEGRWIAIEATETFCSALPAIAIGEPRVTGPSDGSSSPNVIVVVIDGLRADAVGETLTPFLSDAAKRGSWYGNARSPAPWTRPTLASVFSGRSTPNHGVETERASDRLRTGPTLAEVLGQSGYETLGVSANLHLAPPFGLQRGFDTFVSRHLEAPEAAQTATAMLDRSSTRPFFLFLFLMDTHVPRSPRPDYDRSSSLPGEVPSPEQLTSAGRRRRLGIEEPDESSIAKDRAVYEENVAHVDAALEKLLRGLEEQGALDNTVVVITSDHGEAFGEHGDFFHGWNLYDELLRVPLLLFGPGVQPGEVPTPVSLEQLPATLLELAGLTPPEAFARSLPAVGGQPQRLPTFARTKFRGQNLAAVVAWPEKLIVRPGRPWVQLFDLETDPHETKNLGKQRPETVERLRSEISQWLERESTPPFTEAETPELDPELREALRSLGYVTD